MSEKEENKYNTIKKVVDGLITKEEASMELEISKRQIDRLIIKCKEEGQNGFIHKNKGNNNAIKTENKIKEEIKKLYLDEYYDYNFTHFYEDAIQNKYNISYMNMCNILNSDDIISPLAQHKTVNEYNKKMRELTENKTITTEQEILFETRQISQEQAHTRKSNLFMKFGEELEMDAAEYIWFGGIVTYLHLVVDKATKLVLFGWFDYQETMRTYFILLFNIVYLYGIPKKIKTDCRKVFDDKNGEQTHFGSACEELKIELKSNSNPRFKANVERENHTFKNRLKAELRHEEITKIEDANFYLIETFIPKMNAKFAYQIEASKSLMKKNIYTIEQLTLIISERYPRVIDSGSCIKYKSKYYIPIDNNDNEVCFKNKTPATLIIDYNNELRCLIEQEYYKLKEIEKQEYNPAMAAREIQEEISKKERKPYIPGPNHPWRNSHL